MYATAVALYKQGASQAQGADSCRLAGQFATLNMAPPWQCQSSISMVPALSQIWARGQLLPVQGPTWRLCVVCRCTVVDECLQAAATAPSAQCKTLTCSHAAVQSRTRRREGRRSACTHCRGRRRRRTTRATWSSWNGRPSGASWAARHGAHAPRQPSRQRPIPKSHVTPTPACGRTSDG